MYKSAMVHYMNKYPEGRVSATDSALDVYDSEGYHRVALRKNGAMQWVDVSEELGCEDRHDMAPLPQNSCWMKLHKDGKIGRAEEHAEREPINAALAAHSIGGRERVPSCEELREAKAPLVAGEVSHLGTSWSVDPAWLAKDLAAKKKV